MLAYTNKTLLYEYHALMLQKHTHTTWQCILTNTACFTLGIKLRSCGRAFMILKLRNLTCRKNSSGRNMRSVWMSVGYLLFFFSLVWRVAECCSWDEMEGGRDTCFVSIFSHIPTGKFFGHCTVKGGSVHPLKMKLMLLEGCFICIQFWQHIDKSDWLWSAMTLDRYLHNC